MTKLHETIPLAKDWEFAYTPAMPEDATAYTQHSSLFEIAMPVPGYWDDHLQRMSAASFWSKTRFNPNYRSPSFPMGDSPPDAELPYMLGVGWYRNSFRAEPEWRNGLIVLEVGGAVLETNIWLNGNHVLYHLGHSTPFEARLDPYVNDDGANELVIAVSNLRNDRGGCRLRGYIGRSGGICGGVSLKRAGTARIKDCFVHSPESGRLEWAVDTEGAWQGGNLHLEWSVRDKSTGALMDAGHLPCSGEKLRWHSGSATLVPWSDTAPRLYEIEVCIAEGNVRHDSRKQNFGLRRFACEGSKLRLNGKPIMLRGATEHCYFPLTCTPPNEIAFYREIIRKMKNIGFNWIRFHTWVPPEEFMQAADELGMLMQVEPPVGFQEQEWTDILLACRKHPSVVIYCCGNEELLDEPKIEYLRRMAAHCKGLVPDALFNPQEALRGVEYFYERSNLGHPVVEQPYPHNPERLEKLKQFSDVFGQYAWGYLSYDSIRGDWKLLDAWLEKYEKPCLSHENGIHGNYINPDLEGRYASTRIGSDLYASAKAYLKERGVLRQAPVYYQNSCAWMRTLRKHNLETARMCKYIAGYDFLGAIDHHFHRSGYNGGIMNEFYELKYGEAESDVRKYNGSSVLLSDLGVSRNKRSGDPVRVDLFASLYDGKWHGRGRVIWHISDRSRKIVARGEWEAADIPEAEIHRLGSVRFDLPDADTPQKLKIHARLSGGPYEIENDWDLWAFPGLAKTGAANACEGDCLQVAALDMRALHCLRNGGNVLLMGHNPFPSIKTSFQMACSGRVHGNLATVIHDHPLMNAFPHEGYCDWQFFGMLEGGSAVVFDEWEAAFDPIVEVVSSYKRVIKQSALFELNVGQGKLLVCTLNLPEDDPGAAYLVRLMKEYAAGTACAPKRSVDIAVLQSMLEESAKQKELAKTDQGYDPNAQL